jgi:hypothetical protein
VADAAVVRLLTTGVGKLPSLSSIPDKLDQFRDVLGTLKRCKVCAEVLEQLPDAGFGFVAFHDEGVDVGPPQRRCRFQPMSTGKELDGRRADTIPYFLNAPDGDRRLQPDHQHRFGNDSDDCEIELPMLANDLDVGDRDLHDRR